MTHVRAAVFEGVPGRIALRSFPVPDLGPGEILVRVLGCTVCGSDRHSVEGRRVVPVPTVLGHEIVGEVVAFGESPPRRDLAGRVLRTGDRLVWAIVAPCGTCACCLRGLPQKCLRGVKYGHEPLRPGLELLGGFAEYCLLVAGTSVVRVPDALPLEVACPSGCATATVVAALEAAGAVRGRAVCVFGAGMLGLTACAMASARGAAEIHCVDPVADRRDLARRFGATSVAGPSELDDPARPADGDPGFDVVIELSGDPTAFDAAWPRIRIGGTLVLVGTVYPVPPATLPLEEVVRRHLTIRGVHNYAPRHLLQAVEFLEAHHRRAPFADLVARWLPLDAVAGAFAEDSRLGAVRVGIRPAITGEPPCGG